MAGILDGFSSAVSGLFDNSVQPIDTNALNQFNWNYLNNQKTQLTNQLANPRFIPTAELQNQLSDVTTQLSNLEQLAALQNMDPAEMTPLQAMQAQQMLEANTGITGFVNNNFGGWGNVMNGIGQLGNLFMNWKSLGLAEDQLALQQDAFNFNKAVTNTNLANQAKLTNARTKDILQARAHTEKGDKNAYNDEIKRREVKGEI